MTLQPVAVDFGPFWVGDVPAPVEVEFVDDAGDVTDAPEGALSALLVAPGGVESYDLAVERESDDATFVRVEFVEFVSFDVAGVWAIDIVESGGPRMPRLRFVVEAPDGWLTIEDAREDWADAPTRDTTLRRVLNTAKTLCVAFAPPLAVGTLPPDNYLSAQLEYAKSVWGSFKGNEEGQVGADGLAVPVYVRNYNAEALLRPLNPRKKGR